MKGSTKMKIGIVLMRIGIAVWIIENIYFGWNALPMSELEQHADNVVRLFIYLGAGFYTLPLVDLYQKAVKNL